MKEVLEVLVNNFHMCNLLHYNIGSKKNQNNVHMFFTTIVKTETIFYLRLVKIKIIALYRLNLEFCKSSILP